MASLGAAVALPPLSMAVLVAIMTGSGLEVSGVGVVASITAFAIRIAILWNQKGDMQNSDGTRHPR